MKRQVNRRLLSLLCSINEHHLPQPQAARNNTEFDRYKQHDDPQGGSRSDAMRGVINAGVNDTWQKGFCFATSYNDDQALSPFLLRGSLCQNPLKHDFFFFFI